MLINYRFMVDFTQLSLYLKRFYGYKQIKNPWNDSLVHSGVCKLSGLFAGSLSIELTNICGKTILTGEAVPLFPGFRLHGPIIESIS